VAACRSHGSGLHLPTIKYGTVRGLFGNINGTRALWPKLSGYEVEASLQGHDILYTVQLSLRLNVWGVKGAAGLTARVSLRANQKLAWNSIAA
jgi:hypothetical protein